MSILDEIRNRAAQNNVPPRKDVLSNQEQVSSSEIDTLASTFEESGVSIADVPINQNQQDSGSELKRLEEQLTSFPEIAPRIPVRLEAEIKEDLEALCSREKVTVETLLEAFYVTCEDKDTVMRQVLKEAKKRLARRKAAGNIRSSITCFNNLTKKQRRICTYLLLCNCAKVALLKI